MFSHNQCAALQAVTEECISLMGSKHSSSQSQMYLGFRGWVSGQAWMDPPPLLYNKCLEQLPIMAKSIMEEEWEFSDDYVENLLFRMLLDQANSFLLAQH